MSTGLPIQTVQYAGVRYYNLQGTWNAKVTLATSQFQLGNFASQEEAAFAYNEGLVIAMKLLGIKGKPALNTIPDGRVSNDRQKEIKKSVKKLIEDRYNQMCAMEKTRRETFQRARARHDRHTSPEATHGVTSQVSEEVAAPDGLARLGGTEPGESK